MDRKPLEKWTHESGRVTLLGDACHPMLVSCGLQGLFFGNSINPITKPYRAQGAAMAIEDAAVLGNLLSRISHISQLRPLLKAYQDLRLERTASVQAASRGNRRVYQLPDGEEQKRRDENMKKAMASGVTGNRTELWLQPSANQKQSKPIDDGLLGYDADAEVDEWWASHGKGLEGLVGPKAPSFSGDDAAFVCVASACVCFFVFFKL